MSAEPVRITGDEVTVADGALWVRSLVEGDAEVVRAVGESADPVEATRQCLRIGARAMRAAHVSVDVDVVERSFAELDARFQARVGEAVGRITETTAGLLDAEGGALTGALAGFHAELDGLLGSTFDPDSKSSVVSTIEGLVARLVQDSLHQVGRLVSADGPDSPLQRLREQMATDVRDELTGIAEELRRVTDQLGIAAATEEVYERSTGKGFDYEEAVDAVLGGLAAAHGDGAEPCGHEPGPGGSKVGDEVVTLNRDDTGGVDARIVFEVKNRKLGHRSVRDELAKAMANRDALVGVVVFRTQDQAPTSVPFHYVDDTAVVVYDPDDPAGEAALRVAYLWARWAVRRRLAAADADAVDLDRVARLVDDARCALQRHSTVKRCHTTAKKAISEAEGEVASLATEVTEALAELEAALASPPDA